MLLLVITIFTATYVTEAWRMQTVVNLDVSRRTNNRHYLTWEQLPGDSSTRWYYKVEAEYINSGQRKQVVLVNRSTSQSAYVGPLIPCTDYNVWITADAVKTTRSRWGTEEQPGTVGRGKSRRILVTTRSSAPVKHPEIDDIKILISKTSPSNCSARLSWTPQTQPFGCPVLGFNVFVKTPNTWPNAKQYNVTGFNYTVTGLNESSMYPVRIEPFNRFGSGGSSEYFFLSFKKGAGPPIPRNVRVNSGNSCDFLNVTWSPPPQTGKLIRSYNIKINGQDNLTFTMNPYRGNWSVPVAEIGRGVSEIQVYSESDWGTSLSTTTPVFLQGCEEENNSTTLE